MCRWIIAVLISVTAFRLCLARTDLRKAQKRYKKAVRRLQRVRRKKLRIKGSFDPESQVSDDDGSDSDDDNIKREYSLEDEDLDDSDDTDDKDLKNILNWIIFPTTESDTSSVVSIPSLTMSSDSEAESLDHPSSRTGDTAMIVYDNYLVRWANL